VGYKTLTHSRLHCRDREKKYESWSKSFEPGYFPLYFWVKNVTHFSNGVSLVFSKDGVLSACLLCDIQFIEYSRSDTMTEFNIIRYHAVITVFDTGECFATADI